ncbi:MAG: hypothetical protein ABR564_09980 [Candidatus Dormibacteria bacterium]
MGPENGERVVLVRRTNSMTPYRWTGVEPEGFYDVEAAEELGARWEGDELVTYDLPHFLGLYEYFKNNDYLIDND